MSAYLTRTNSGVGNRRTMTWSFWIKFNRGPDAFNITTSTDGGETILVVDEPSDLGTASSTLVIKTWALEPLCYYVASIGLLQKSKDSFYREASEKLLEFYERVL